MSHNRVPPPPTRFGAVAVQPRVAASQRGVALHESAGWMRTPFGSGIAAMRPPNRGAEVNPKDQRTAKQAMPAQQKTASYVQAGTAQKKASSPFLAPGNRNSLIQFREIPAPIPARSDPRVLQRHTYSSAFDNSLTANQDNYVVTQVDTNAGMFGHSELFIESWNSAKTRRDITRIHLNTLNGTRIEISKLAGALRTDHIRDSKSYIVNQQQVDSIMSSALIFRNKMESGFITYAELFPSDWSRWKEAGRTLRIETSCKTFTDVLLIEAGLRAKAGGWILNAPWDL